MSTKRCLFVQGFLSVDNVNALLWSDYPASCQVVDVAWILLWILQQVNAQGIVTTEGEGNELRLTCIVVWKVSLVGWYRLDTATCCLLETNVLVGTTTQNVDGFALLLAQGLNRRGFGHAMQETHHVLCRGS